jgi:hypothetical protein
LAKIRHFHLLEIRPPINSAIIVFLPVLNQDESPHKVSQLFIGLADLIADHAANNGPPDRSGSATAGKHSTGSTTDSGTDRRILFAR